jgi:CheY-like chemotaxis protein
MNPAALVVDDDATVRQLGVLLLRRAGFNPVDTAADGHEALELLLRREYALLLLDLRMPVLSGYELLEILSADPLPHMPVIVVATADRMAEEHDFGPVVAGLLTKPYDVPTLIMAVRGCLDDGAAV